MPHIIYIFFLGIASGVRAVTAVAVLCWLAWAGLLPVHGWAGWPMSLAVAVTLSVLALAEDTLAAWTARRPGSFPANSRLRGAKWVPQLLFAGLVGAVGATCVYQPAAGGMLGAWAGVLAGVWLGPRLRMLLVWCVGPGVLASLLESTAALWVAFAFAVQLAQTSRAQLRAPFI